MPDLPANGPTSARVLQATGVISVQADCTLATAFDLLRERAFALDQPLDVTALYVLEHLVRFDD
jgi:hypothetical protein